MGHCPQYLFRFGDTYGSQTHKVLIDPTVNHAQKLVLSDRTTDDYQVNRPHQTDIDIVESRYRNGDPVYKHPTIPGYEGFVPHLNGQLGQRYMVQATEALSEFEQLQVTTRNAVNQITREVALQDGKYNPTNMQDKQLVKSEFKLPLMEVRPEACGVMRNLPVNEPVYPPPDPGLKPYFMDVTDPGKSFMNGYAGHVPYGYSKYGTGFTPYTNSALCDFSSNYRRRQSTEWAPVNVIRPDPPFLIQPTEIYHKHVGMLPNYMGHLPGAVFRSGKTFGNDTRDAKRWLRGDFSI